MLSESLKINTTLTTLWLSSDEIEVNEKQNKTKQARMKTIINNK